MDIDPAEVGNVRLYGVESNVLKLECRMTQKDVEFVVRAVTVTSDLLVNVALVKLCG